MPFDCYTALTYRNVQITVVIIAVRTCAVQIGNMTKEIFIAKICSFDCQNGTFCVYRFCAMSGPVFGVGYFCDFVPVCEARKMFVKVPFSAKSLYNLSVCVWWDINPCSIYLSIY